MPISELFSAPITDILKFSTFAVEIKYLTTICYELIPAEN